MTLYDTLHAAMLDGTAGHLVHRWATNLLDEVMQGRTTVPAIRHPLGFSCLPVERVGERGVCVHVWSDSLPRTDSTTSTVHAHSWDLVSYVLYGAVRNEVIDVRDGPTHRLFEIRSGPGAGGAADDDAGTDEVRATARLVRHETMNAEVVHRGEVYSLPAGVFHRTAVGRDTATVALGCGRPGLRDRALGGLDTPTHQVRRHRCDRDETLRAARVMIEQLARVPAPRNRRQP